MFMVEGPGFRACFGMQEQAEGDLPGSLPGQHTGSVLHWKHVHLQKDHRKFCGSDRHR